MFRAVENYWQSWWDVVLWMVALAILFGILTLVVVSRDAKAEGYGGLTVAAGPCIKADELVTWLRLPPDTARGEVVSYPGAYVAATVVGEKARVFASIGVAYYERVVKVYVLGAPSVGVDMAYVSMALEGDCLAALHGEPATTFSEVGFNTGSLSRIDELLELLKGPVEPTVFQQHVSAGGDNGLIEGARDWPFYKGWAGIEYEKAI